MDEFLKINWHPPLEDMIDNVFINEERLKQESVMYRIMRGSFLDPFDKFDISDDNEVEFDDEEQEEEEQEEKEENKNEEAYKKETGWKAQKNAKKLKQQNSEQKGITQQTFKTYVPGIAKPTFKFPKFSLLDSKQQALCLRVMQLFSGSKIPEITQTNREELETYMKLKPIIHEEQNEFLELAKKNWDSTRLKIILEEYINIRWKSKIQNAKKLHRYYLDVGSIALTAEQKIGVRFDSTLLEMGDVPRIIIPILTRQYILSRNFDKLCQDFLPEGQIHLGPKVLYKVPVSEDPNCQTLANECGADLVISSSGLNCLASSCCPGFTSSWILPMVVKEHNGRTVIYVDKPLPPTTMTVPQKNTWVHKYLLKINLLHPRHPTSIRFSERLEENEFDDKLFGDLNSDELLKLEEERDNIAQADRKRKCDILESLQEKANAASKSNKKTKQSNSERKMEKQCEDKIASQLTGDNSESKRTVEMPENISKDFFDSPNISECELSIDMEVERENDSNESDKAESKSILETPESPPPETTILRSYVKIIPNGDTSPNLRNGNDFENSDTEINFVESRREEIVKLINGHDDLRDEKVSSFTTDIMGNDSETARKKKNAFLKPPPGSNVTYNVFTIGSDEPAQNEIIKSTVDDYKILVRSRIDGVEVCGRQSEKMHFSREPLKLRWI